MVFQKGNQAAAGSSYNLEEEAKALDAWSVRDDAMHLGEFAEERNIWPQRLYEWRDESTMFADALKKAHNRIALRLTKKTTNHQYNYGIYQRYIGMYDKLLTSHEREEKAYESKLRKSEQENNSQYLEEAIIKQQAILDQLKNLQSSARKIADNNINNETKS